VALLALAMLLARIRDRLQARENDASHARLVPERVIGRAGIFHAPRRLSLPLPNGYFDTS